MNGYKGWEAYTIERRLRIKAEVINAIEQTIGKNPPECGGVLGARSDDIVSVYYFDKTGKTTPSFYSPDTNTTNRVLEYDWLPKGFFMVGIIHSHSDNSEVPSCIDIKYGIQILEMLDTVDYFYLPIVTFDSGRLKITPYVVMKSDIGEFVCRRIDLEVLQ